MTKRYIGELQESAERGDREAIAILESAGLWGGEEDDGGGFFDQDDDGNNRCTTWGEGDYGGVEGPDGMIYSDAGSGL